MTAEPTSNPSAPARRGPPTLVMMLATLVTLGMIAGFGWRRMLVQWHVSRLESDDERAEAAAALIDLDPADPRVREALREAYGRSPDDDMLTALFAVCGPEERRELQARALARSTSQSLRLRVPGSGLDVPPGAALPPEIRLKAGEPFELVVEAVAISTREARLTPDCELERDPGLEFDTRVGIGRYVDMLHPSLPRDFSLRRRAMSFDMNPVQASRPGRYRWRLRGRLLDREDRPIPLSAAHAELVVIELPDIVIEEGRD